MFHSAFDHVTHTPYSNPGRHADLVAGLPTDPVALSAVARNIIVHYRASGHQLPPSSSDDINARWLEATLELDQSRHAAPLDAPRSAIERVQGCCRDHTLFCIGVLRSHGIPARSRVGFAGYFQDGWHHDHVIVEALHEGRWQRFDSELEAPVLGLNAPMGVDHFPISSSGFVTAAQVWLAHRRGEIDAETYGVDPSVPGMRGERFVFDEVIYEVAHRFGDELLLWDTWGQIGGPDKVVNANNAKWIDEVAKLLIQSDSGNEAAEKELLDQYCTDTGLRPGTVITQESPRGHPPIKVQLPEREQ